jgi:hypothetical protein
MQVTIYIPRENEREWEQMKLDAKKLSMGIGAYMQLLYRDNNDNSRERNEAGK